MSIYVGRSKGRFDPNGFPHLPNVTNIVVITNHRLSPFVLRNEQGILFENYWQFSKIYPYVPNMNHKSSGWTYPKEVHINGNIILPEYSSTSQSYLNWRYKGMLHPKAVRYPVGKELPISASGNGPRSGPGTCLGSLNQYDINNNIYKLLNYVEARKEIYLKEYTRLVKLSPAFTEIKKKLSKGESVGLIDVDGPHQESLEYYKQNYNVDNNFIVNNFMYADKNNLKLMLYDTKHAFGHCYCLAAALLGIENEL